MDNIKVSVICLTYNHQKYIRQCLESLVNQETDFNYEIIVHDDASTDNTADIVREFEKQYPEKMITIYQTENQYSKNVKITRNYIFPIVRGKYIAYCEGDDFWTDNHKLQIQFDAMEKNNKLRFCVHRVLTCDESGTAANTFFLLYAMLCFIDLIQGGIYGKILGHRRIPDESQNYKKVFRKQL